MLEKRRITIYLMISVVLLLSAVVAVSLSYFVVEIKHGSPNSGPNFKVGVNTNTSGITINKIKDIDVQNKRPGYKDILAISVGVSESTTYDLNISGSNNIVTGINYTVYKTNEAKNVSVSCNNVDDQSNNQYYGVCTISNIESLGSSVSSGTITSSDTAKTILSNESLSSGTVYYYIVIDYPNINASQDGDFNTVLNYTLTVNINDNYSVLPSDYTQLEYLESTGGQYINTLLRLNNGIHVTGKINITTNSSDSTTIIGADDSFSSQASEIKYNSLGFYGRKLHPQGNQNNRRCLRRR